MKKFSFREVMPCLLAILVDILGFGLVTPLLVVLFATENHNVFQVETPALRYLYLGITMAIYPLLMFFGTSFIGDLSDIIGRKKTLLISMVGMTAAFFCMGLSIMWVSLPLFFIGRALSGLASASQSVALATISDLSTKENKAIHLSYVAFVQCIGFVLGPLIGGVLSRVSLQAPFLASALLAFFIFLWIAYSFQETFTKKSDKKISIARVFKVFVEAYHDRRIRDLSLIFLIMQAGVGLYMLVILVLFATHFRYTPFALGLFNGYLGLGFALGLVVVLPRLLKSYKIEKIVYLCLCLTAVTEFISGLFMPQILLWAVALIWAVAVEIGFSGMFTSFSNAADESSQGWAMGVAVAVLAIAFAITGACTQLVPTFGPYPLIAAGGVLLAWSAFLMRRYCAKYPI